MDPTCGLVGSFRLFYVSTTFKKIYAYLYNNNVIHCSFNVIDRPDTLLVVCFGLLYDAPTFMNRHHSLIQLCYQEQCESILCS